MVFLAALCSSRRNRKTSTPRSPLSHQSPEKNNSTTPAEEPSPFLQPPPIQVQDHQPPPSSPRLEKETTGDGATLMRVTSCVPRGKSTTSRRKLSGSLSMSLPEGLPRIRMGIKKEQKTAEKEESIWKKTIILGDRCRVPSDDEEEVALYDENGHRKRNYRPKTPRSLPISRTNSFVDHDANQVF